MPLIYLFKQMCGKSSFKNDLLSLSLVRLMKLQIRDTLHTLSTKCIGIFFHYFKIIFISTFPVFIEFLLCSRHKTGHWRYKCKQNRASYCPHDTYNLVWEQTINNLTFVTWWHLEDINEITGDK